MSAREANILELFERVRKAIEKKQDGVEAVFGECCGQGVQKGVAISTLPKMFVIFGVKVQFCEKEQEDEWLDISEMEELRDEDARVFNIHQFGSFEVKIDFNDERSVERGRERMEFILEAEKECPVGQYFGVKGTGKGIVWQVVQCEGVPEMGAKYMEDRFWCKTKGVKHTEFRKEPKMKKVK